MVSAIAEYVHVVQVGHQMGRGWTFVGVCVKVVMEWSECGSVLVDCSLMEKPEPLVEKDQLVLVNFWKSKKK
jgi:hypothetical protein